MMEHYYVFIHKEKATYFFIGIFPDRIATIINDKPHLGFFYGIFTRSAIKSRLNN